MGATGLPVPPHPTSLFTSSVILITSSAVMLIEKDIYKSGNYAIIEA